MQTYLHSLELTNWQTCWLLSLKGILTSPNEFVSNNPAFDFQTKPEDSLLNVMTPFPTPTAISLVNNTNLIRKEVELDFEAVRADSFPHLPSRLHSLWVAENSEQGIILIESIFGNDKSRKTLVVTVTPTSKIHRADKRWYENYFENKNKEFINNYWKGLAYNKIQKWEFLIDGSFLIEKKDMVFLRKHVKNNFADKIGAHIIAIAYKINKIS